MTAAERSTSARAPVSRRALLWCSIRARRWAGTSPSVPASIWAASAFTYYAVIRDNTTGRTIVVPHGGSSAPQFSFAMSSSSIDLGRHTFGSTRQASARVASAGWGGGDQQVGLEDGVDMPTGAASFDVDSSGDVYLLDEAHARMLEFPVGGSPQTIALPGLAGVKADLRVSDAVRHGVRARGGECSRAQTAAALVHAAGRRSDDDHRSRRCRGTGQALGQHGLRVRVPVEHVGACPAGERADAGRPVLAAGAGLPGRPGPRTETSSC